MTREEKAIIYFKDMRKRLCEDYLVGIPKDSVAYIATMAEKEFYDTAIKALEQESILDKIRAEIKALTDGEEPEHIWNVDALAIIDKYKAEKEDNE